MMTQTSKNVTIKHEFINFINLTKSHSDICEIDQSNTFKNGKNIPKYISILADNNINLNEYTYLEQLRIVYEISQPFYKIYIYKNIYELIFGFFKCSCKLFIKISPPMKDDYTYTSIKPLLLEIIKTQIDPDSYKLSEQITQFDMIMCCRDIPVEIISRIYAYKQIKEMITLTDGYEVNYKEIKRSTRLRF